MKRIEFSENWNGKLCQDLFTTVRLYNPDKYMDLHKYEVCFKGEPIGVAELVMKHYFKYRELNERTALIDCGKSLGYMQRLMTRFYGDHLTPDKPMYLLFFEFTERYMDPSVNLFKHRWEKVTEVIPAATQKELFTD